MADPASSSSAPRRTVAVAEDHPVMRDGHVSLLECEGGFTVSGRASMAPERRALIAAGAPQALVTDLMPGEADGRALLTDLAALAPALRLVVFSLQAGEIYAERCLRAGELNRPADSAAP